VVRSILNCVPLTLLMLWANFGSFMCCELVKKEFLL